MALDTVSTVLVGASVGTIGVLVRSAGYYVDHGLARAPRRAAYVLFFTFLAGVLFAWVWRFASPVLLPTVGLPGALSGFLWGALVWATFTLPSELGQLAWGRTTPESAALDLGSWLVQFLVGGALCGVYLSP